MLSSHQKLYFLRHCAARLALYVIAAAMRYCTMMRTLCSACKGRQDAPRLIS